MENRYRNLPVVDEEGLFLGVFGVHCLLRSVLPKAVLVKDGLETVPFVRETLKDLRQRLANVEDQPVTVCLSEDIPVVNPETPLLETLLVLYRNRISIPVVEKGTGLLVGMISYFDVGENILAQEQ
jgi:CBS-domain-containing membrane protein